MVAPRFPSGVFTYNKFFTDKKYNMSHWVSLYNGGPLFETILYNPVSIFMTHLGI